MPCPSRAVDSAGVRQRPRDEPGGDQPDYYASLSAADVLLRDGSGMAILLRRLGLAPGLNMNGTDFIPKILAAYKGRARGVLGPNKRI
jgi:hypothetical protein